MDDIPKSVVWVLGGSSVAIGMLTLVGLAPRLAGAYPWPLFIAIMFIVLGLVFGCTAAILQLLAANRTHGPTESDSTTPAVASSNRHRSLAIGSVALGMASILIGTAVLAVAYALTLNTDDVPRLSLSVSGADQPDLATVKVKFEADDLNPGQFIVVDLIALPRVPPGVKIPASRGARVPGRRIYRGAIGSDSKGQVTSEIQTNIHREDVGIVVAEVWPGPLNTDSSTPNNLHADTQMCGDIQRKEIRSCAYAEVPL